MDLYLKATVSFQGTMNVTANANINTPFHVIYDYTSATPTQVNYNLTNGSPSITETIDVGECRDSHVVDTFEATFFSMSFLCR